MPLTPEQLAARKIGGSDVATILGLNPYKTNIELYAEMVGDLERPDLSGKQSVEAGVVLEDGIAELTARRLSERDGREIKLRKSNITIVNPKYPWLTAHIDRDVVGEDRGVEIKNVGANAARFWGEPGTDEIPDYYLPQPHTYMICKGYKQWVVSGYFGGADLRLYDIEYSQEMADIIIESTHAFWQCVQNRTPPEFDPAHKAAISAMKRLYPGTNGETIEADPSLTSWVDVFEQAKRLESHYKKTAEVASAHVMWAMRDNAVMKLPNGDFFTRKVVKRKGYTVEDTSYMDFRLKKAKGEPNGE